MIEITAEIRAFIDKAAAGVELAEDEYIDPSDGLIHCKKCGGQRQTVVPCFGKSGYFMPRCICQCQREAEEQRKAAEERQRRMERIKRRKAQGLQDRYGCFVYDGQRSCTGSSRPAGIGRNQAALGAIYQPAARLCVSLQRPAERKNVIYQTRCQEPYNASGTFFVDFL